jgi:protein-disulfide isomerase
LIRLLTRLFARISCLIAMSVVSFNAIDAVAQTQVPAAPTQPNAPAAQAVPSAPAPAAAPTFPPPDPKDFTAAAPTKETINAFLTSNWGYDQDRMWQVQAILKTEVDGLSKVVVYVGDKSGKQKPTALEFFALPDGKHIITGDQIMPFGAHPFADARAKAEERADGPYRGAAAKDLELVEFFDLQCPHCKEAQANMDKLIADFPKARIVVQNFPLPSIHPSAMIAAQYGVCVAKQAGSAAFFQYEAAVFDGQDGLGTPDGTTLTLNSAVTKAGLDPAKVSACANAPETKASVESSIKLGNELGITEVPTILVNGRPIPGNAPYEVLKQVIQYQAKLDGIAQ